MAEVVIRHLLSVTGFHLRFDVKILVGVKLYVPGIESEWTEVSDSMEKTLWSTLKSDGIEALNQEDNVSIEKSEVLVVYSDNCFWRRLSFCISKASLATIHLNKTWMHSKIEGFISSLLCLMYTESIILIPSPASQRLSSRSRSGRLGFTSSRGVPISSNSATSASQTSNIVSKPHALMNALISFKSVRP